jgi:class 3 adenylate cyclase/tetratricopeptide (TPR) repeat protein
MHCPTCRFDNRESAKYCLRCGQKLEFKCLRCNRPLPFQANFCDDCGQQLEKPFGVTNSLLPKDSERKYITVLFSDMAGYTAMTEKLDPEEVKEIMKSVLIEISKIITKYDGFLEKNVGDAVLSLFGVPTAHEDDPVRAIKAAKEIHDVVSAISVRFEKQIGKRLIMHTGIHSGLVVTGEINIERGTHGVLGETINIASRLSELAAPGEIVVGADTKSQTEGYFVFEPLEPTVLKGKVEPVRPFKVLALKAEPSKTHRLTGIRAKLIGRKAEISQLNAALIDLRHGKGSIFSVAGDAGTGKSRLIEEFKNSINVHETQWLDAHAYAYAQNIPYFPLVNLLSRAWDIQDGDTLEQVTKKVESGANLLLGSQIELIPYVASLYSIKHPDIENVSPDFWKSKLHEAIKYILASLADKTSTIVCFEDLHWADPSSVELLRSILTDFNYPTMFIFIYRPPFSLFSSHQTNTIKSYHEIRLQDLSPSDSQSMIESLLNTDSIPVELSAFIRDKTEGNPFYLEEMINSILETGILIREDNKWKTTNDLSQANIPSNIQGVISARLDRLEIKSKTILQEASVIGRTFLYEVLKRITETKEYIDQGLMILERLDLIRAKILQPDLEYFFKHALTQEVVYNGLLKKERQKIHDRIGRVMEEFFYDRLPEFYEGLAYHFAHSPDEKKAAEYLIKAGDKAFKRYAIDEAHYFYLTAFKILNDKTQKSQYEEMLFMDLLIEWAMIYHIKGVFSEYIGILKKYENFAVAIGNNEKLGMFYARLSNALHFNLEIKDACYYAQKALKLGEEIRSEKIICYSCTSLCYALGELGSLDDAIFYGRKVMEFSSYMTDRYLFRLLNSALSSAYYMRGEVSRCREIGLMTIDYGIKNNEPRCQSTGFRTLALSYFAAGDFVTTIEYAQKAVKGCPEPYFYVWAKTVLGMSYFANGQHRDAEETFGEIARFDQEYNSRYVGTVARFFIGVLTIVRGELAKGIGFLEDLIKFFSQSGNQYRLAGANHILGRVYLKLLQGGDKKNINFIIKNFGFLIKTLPFLSERAENHLNVAITVAKKIGAKGILAQALLDMGQLRKKKGLKDEAKKYIGDAIQLFEECQADVFIKHAREALASL